jgi:hypothetical protein
MDRNQTKIDGKQNGLDKGQNKKHELRVLGGEEVR